MKEATTRGVGSADFCAPEVPQEAPRPDDPPFEWTIKADIYSLGRTVAYLMTLVPPSDRHTATTSNDLPSEYSIELRSLISRCLEQQPQPRPTSLDILAASIRHANWNSTFVGPYGGLISEDFTDSILSSLNSCGAKTNLPDIKSPVSSFSSDAARVYLDNMGAHGDPFDPLFTGAFFARVAPHVPDSENFSRLSLNARPKRDKKEGNFILSLDGGGIRSISSLLIIKALMELCGDLEIAHDPAATSSYYPISCPDPDEGGVERKSSRYLPAHYFDYIAGVSTGGLLAIMLSRLRMNVEDCITQYLRIGKIVTNRKPMVPFFYRPDMYDASKLRYEIEELVVLVEGNRGRAKGELGVFKSNPERAKTIVVAMKTEPDLLRLYLFRSYDHLFEMRTRFDSVLNPGPAQQAPIWAVACAAIAAPLGSKSMKIGTNEFMDALLHTKNPALHAFREVKQMHISRSDSVTLTVSIGAGRSNLKARSIFNIPRGISVMLRMQKLLGEYDDSIDYDMFRYQDRHQDALPGKLYERFDVKSGLQDIGEWEWKSNISNFSSRTPLKITYAKIQSATQAYLDQPEVQERLRGVAERLVKKRRERAQDLAKWRVVVGND